MILTILVRSFIISGYAPKRAGLKLGIWVRAMGVACKLGDGNVGEVVVVVWASFFQILIRWDKGSFI